MTRVGIRGVLVDGRDSILGRQKLLQPKEMSIYTVTLTCLDDILDMRLYRLETQLATFFIRYRRIFHGFTPCNTLIRDRTTCFRPAQLEFPGRCAFVGGTVDVVEFIIS